MRAPLKPVTNISEPRRPRPTVRVFYTNLGDTGIWTYRKATKSKAMSEAFARLLEEMGTTARAA